MKRTTNMRWAVLPIALLATVTLLASCGGGEEKATQEPASTPTAAPPVATGEPGPYLLLNQKLIEGFTAPAFDLEDVDAMFWQIFSGLADEVTIYPSENYYYFILNIDGRQIWGNIRLAAGSRDRGVLSFGYFEFDEFPSGPSQGLSRSKFFTEADGLRIEQIDRFTYDVNYNRKKVTFNLHQIPQVPPMNADIIGEDEVSEEF